MATFDQQMAMHKLTQTIARMTLPAERDKLNGAQAVECDIEDLEALYDIIDEARDILKNRH